MRHASLTILAGGTPAPAHLAALVAAATALIEGERRAPADPTPTAYRSRWRRASLIESSEGSFHLKDDRAAWGVH